MSRPSVEILDFFHVVLSIRNELQTDLSEPTTRESSTKIVSQLDKLNNILNTTSDLETKCDQRMTNFIFTTLMPVAHWLKTTQVPHDRVLEAWLRCMHAVLAKTHWHMSSPPQMAEQLLILFTTYINAAKPEEAQQLAVQCISTILSAVNENEHSLQVLRDLKCRPQMAACIAALLDVIRRGDALSLRVDAMHTLATMLLETLGEVDIVATLLPGVVSTLGRTIYQKQEKENHKILSLALDILGDIIVFVLRDECAPEFIVQDVQSLHALAAHMKGKQPVDKMQETIQKFYETSKTMIKKQLDFILGIRTYNTDWRVRRSMVRTCGKLLSRCSRTLENCTALLLKTIVLHIDDEYTQVGAEAQFQINEIMQAPAFEQSIIPTLKENLSDSIVYAPSVLISGDEGDKVNAMALITGYVLILGNRHAGEVLDSAISKTLDAWLAALEIDRDGLNVLEEQGQKNSRYLEFYDGYADDSEPVSVWEQPSLVYPKTHFKHLVADRTVAQAGRMLNVIGRIGNLTYWRDLLMNCFQSDGDQDVQPQAAYMIHSLLSGASSAESDSITARWLDLQSDDEKDEETSKIKAIALQVLHEIVSLVIDPTTKTRTSVVPLGHHKINPELESAEVLATCFSLQIVGLVACILEMEYVQDELITLLYPLLAHLGSPNVFIHTYALITLDAIALVCGQRGARQLAIENIDYIINMVSQRISVLEDNLRAPLVLKALIRIGGPGTIDYLDDTVEEIFDALDGYHMDGWSCAQLCSVLTEIVRVLYRKNAAVVADDEVMAESNQSDDQISDEIQELIDADSKGAEDTTETATMEEIGKYFLDRQEKDKKPKSMDPNDLLLDDGDDGDDEYQNEKPADDTPEPLSRSQQMTLDIMTKARHFLTAGSPQLRVEMLGLFAAGTKVLALRIDKFGVLVNGAWPSIMQRLWDDENMVVLQAVAVIGSIAESLKDFVSGRFKDLWPRFKELLKQGRGESYHYSAFSYHHRLHHAILLTLASVVEYCQIEASKMPEIMGQVKWYMDERLNAELQESAVKVLEAIGKRDPDTVWLHMMSLLSNNESTIVDDSGSFEPFSIPEWMRTQDQWYRKNARRILELVQ
ncbi:armadillo-type protein [Fennellomyces sp. T-0311]|nr:armadillo-type protein [Fennellomyces sp. T-0311]